MHLQDRPNLADQILGGNLTFSDGTRIQFGELNNDGTATVINLGRTVTCKSLLVTVTKVSATTTSAGLSEIQVYLADATKFTSVYSPTSWALAAKAATPAPVVVATTSSAAAAATTTAAQTTPAGVTFTDGSSTQVLCVALPPLCSRLSPSVTDSFSLYRAQVLRRHDDHDAGGSGDVRRSQRLVRRDGPARPCRPRRRQVEARARAYLGAFGTAARSRLPPLSWSCSSSSFPFPGL